ncbi:hypothetical protein VPNG_01342 [Cytospora leucostoma]|uniref:Heterokaryon incompatibility domain-containing protein n=1 Tax=Cytospora leucostoma TaxID=1230097 RepID=A0A423XL53_9PEZI|nr:hypothetical protein VPNG_01342 [Cytospora leucostoma]
MFATEEIDNAELDLSGVTRLWKQVFQASKGQASRRLYTCPLSQAFTTTYSMDFVNETNHSRSEHRAAWMQHLHISDDRASTLGSLTTDRQQLEDTAKCDIRSIHKVFSTISHQRSFIILNSGNYGLVPGFVVEGDVCGVIFGTRCPFILRKTDEEDHYKLVGGAWVLSRHTLGVNGNIRMGKYPEYDDWQETGAQEQDIYIC